MYLFQLEDESAVWSIRPVGSLEISVEILGEIAKNINLQAS